MILHRFETLMIVDPHESVATKGAYNLATMISLGFVLVFHIFQYSHKLLYSLVMAQYPILNFLGKPNIVHLHIICQIAAP